jgi:CRP-like cAMP-binding protein
VTITTGRRDLDTRALAAPPRLLFRLTAQQRKLVVQSAEVRKYQPHSVIVTAGDPAIHLFLLTKGKLKYYRVNERGDEVLLWWLLTGECFGLGAFMGEPGRYVGTAEAVTDCELLVWNRRKLRSFGAALDDLLAENACQTLMYYLEEYTDRLVGAFSDTAKQRLARTLIQLGRRTGHVRGGRVDLEVTNEVVATLSNVSVFTASRQIKEWERTGAVQKGRGKIRILDAEKLAIV